MEHRGGLRRWHSGLEDDDSNLGRWLIVLRLESGDEALTGGNGEDVLARCSLVCPGHEKEGWRGARCLIARMPTGENNDVDSEQSKGVGSVQQCYCEGGG
jgi:hypothetical protein